jgi:membrane protease YdiL (CAAX protease family)
MTTMRQEHLLQRAFTRKPYLTGLAVTIVSFLFTGGGRALFTALLGDGAHVEATAAGLQQGVLTVGVLILIWRMEWFRLSRIWSHPRRPASWWPLLILPAGIIPLAGLFDVDWSKPATVAASTFAYTTTGLVEELMFRGLILAGLSIGLAGKPNATLKAVVASSILFGLPHVAPIGILFAAVFGLSFASLAIWTNTIWVGVAVHIAFDLFIDLPDATAGVSGRWYLFIPLAFVLVSGIAAAVGARQGHIGGGEVAGSSAGAAVR